MDARVRYTLSIIDGWKEANHFSLVQLSGFLGVSDAYLMRLFHRETGKPFREYLRELRMTAAAAALVKQNAKPIKQIALEYGYRDVSNFRRDFKKVHVITPNKFRLRELEAKVRRAAAGK